MTQHFNLLKEPWLSCLRLDGQYDLLSLRDLLIESHELRDLHDDSPLTIAALYRFLLAVLYAVYQPQNRSDWQAIWQENRLDPDKIDEYLSKTDIQDRFDLFHETNPFYQTLERFGKPLSLAALFPERVGGNNPTLFDHSIDEERLVVTLAEAARLLITGQAFSLGGGNSGIKGKNFTDAPCSRGVLCFAEGQNLFETLILNLVPYDWQEDIFVNAGVPAWEMANPIEDDREIPTDLLDYLTWQSRRLRLDHESDILVVYRSQALSLAKESVRFDPLKPYRATEKDGYKLVRLSEKRALWRDSNALFRITGKDHRPALVIDWLAALTASKVLSVSQKYHLLVIGLSTEPGQAKKLFSRLERIPLPLRLTTDSDLLLILDRALSNAEGVMGAVHRAAHVIGMHIHSSDADNKKWGDLKKNEQEEINDWVNYTGMERSYWAGLDIPFQSFIIDLVEDEEEALSDWYEQLEHSARGAFEQVAEYAGAGPRSFKAIVRGQSYLNYRLNELLPQKEKTA